MKPAEEGEILPELFSLLNVKEFSNHLGELSGAFHSVLIYPFLFYSDNFFCKVQITFLFTVLALHKTVGL